MGVICFLYVKRSMHKNVGELSIQNVFWSIKIAWKKHLSYSFYVGKDIAIWKLLPMILICYTVTIHVIKCLCVPCSFHFSVTVIANSLQRHNCEGRLACICIFFSALLPASSIFMSYNETGNNRIGVFYTSVFKFSKHLCVPTICE